MGLHIIPEWIPGDFHVVITTNNTAQAYPSGDPAPLLDPGPYLEHGPVVSLPVVGWCRREFLVLENHPP